MASVTNGSTIIDIGAGPEFFNELFKKHKYFSFDVYPYSGVDVVTDIVQDQLPIKQT